MRKHFAILGLAVLALPLSQLRAQTVQLDSATMLRTMAAGMRMMTPAKAVLERSFELHLSPDQVTALTKLVGDEKDSATARQARMIETMRDRAQGFTADAINPMAWTGTIDEAKMRADACRNSGMQVETMIGMARDRRAVGAVLTPAQRMNMDALEMEAMMKAHAKP